LKKGEWFVKWLNYHHLIYFREIATLGSIARASESLKVGQPALSSQLKSFEELLGVQLFERRNRRLILTEAGKVTLDYANRINSLGQELIQVVDERSFSNKIHLSVGALDSIPKHLICDIVDFAHKKTGCFLSIYEDSSEELLRQLLAHSIELIITDHEVRRLDNRKVFCKEILKKPIFAYASPEFKKLKNKFPQSLDGVSCIVPTIHSKVRSDIESFFHHKKIKPKMIAETQDTSLQKILASKGDGVVFLPDFTTKELVQNNSLLKLGELKGIYSSYYLVYGSRVFDNPALDLILKQDFARMRLG
jgi:LysR family transcriptional activator of nhaA